MIDVYHTDTKYIECSSIAAASCSQWLSMLAPGEFKPMAALQHMTGAKLNVTASFTQASLLFSSLLPVPHAVELCIIVIHLESARPGALDGALAA